MTLATSKNLTLVGILTILAVLATAGIALFDGNDATNVNWEATFVGISAGVGMILGKGAKSTGGVVDGAGVPVVDPAPPKPAP